MAGLAAAACDVDPSQALVMSTGVIGEFLPMDRIASGVKAAAAAIGDQEPHLLSAARGIMTTDTAHKIAGRTLTVNGREIRVTGLAKGAGMIGPRMATMLTIILTDASVHPADAQQALVNAVDQSFNCISVEGHMSTNDTVLLLASGEAMDRPLTPAEMPGFETALNEVCVDLARMIPNDGEGASHLITLNVRGCASRDDAHRIATSIANSALVKTGIAGADPNWGRFLSAAGQTGVDFRPDQLTLSLNGTVVYMDGAPTKFDRSKLSTSIRENRETVVDLQFNEGDASIRFWTSDLTVDYVRFNAEYTT
jgi:glutamate N-acetyltransferase/amino-acid N-acetyltransferase